jgi:hypothetical protein
MKAACRKCDDSARVVDDDFGEVHPCGDCACGNCTMSLRLPTREGGCLCVPEDRCNWDLSPEVVADVD